jgi:integrin alpha FG-GAP repeat containing protein 1
MPHIRLTHTVNFQFTQAVSFRHPNRVHNVVPGDFTQDGKLDLLVMAQSEKPGELAMSIYLAKFEGGFGTDPLS